MTANKIKLGVNVDHVATLRNARGTQYPDPYAAAKLVKLAGADGITIHLREDRRHIVDSDVERFCNKPLLPINLEIGATLEMQAIAIKNLPHEVCLVPEKREELTTEGGLDVCAREAYLSTYIAALQAVGIKVSLFIDPDTEQVRASQRVGADIVELHTGAYAELFLDDNSNDSNSYDVSRHKGNSLNADNKTLLKNDRANAELERIKQAAALAHSLNLVVNAGHGLTVNNVAAMTVIPEIYSLNIGHAIVARAVFVGLENAVREMSQAIASA